MRMVRLPQRIAGGLFVALALLSLVFLAGLGGAFIVLHKVWPYYWLYSAYRAGVAAVEAETEYDSPEQTNMWAKARRPDRGVTIYERDRAYDGLTLYTSSHAPTAFLIAMDGKVVQQWQLPYSRVWDATAEVRHPRPDPFVYFRKAHLFANGDLLVVYEALGDTPYSYGLVKMNRRSEVIWKYLDRVHHDVDVTPDGTIYALSHQVRWNRIEGFINLDPPRIDDFVVVLSPDGHELKKVSVIDAFLRSAYAPLLAAAPPNDRGDYLHTNAVEAIGAEAAARLPFAKPGQVLISFRETSTIAVLDLERQEIVWVLRGPWLGQHDPDILANGDFLLFDNGGRIGPGG